MTTVYVITRVLTFFGAVLRTFWEHLVCRMCKIPVEDIRVFKNDELCGHIEHEFAENLKHSFLICWLPFTLNFILGCAFLLTGSFRLFYIGESIALENIGLLWLGISCFANCAPSYEDALLLKDYIQGCKKIVVKVLVYPFFAVAYASAFLERFSITFPVSVLVSIIFPRVFTLFFPILDYFDQLIG